MISIMYNNKKIMAIDSEGKCFMSPDKNITKEELEYVGVTLAKFFGTAISKERRKANATRRS